MRVLRFNWRITCKFLIYKNVFNFGIVIDMRKHVTRTEKYKEYREEIKNSSLSFENENVQKKESKTISQVLKETKESLTQKNQQPGNKHSYDKREEKQLEKSVYDIYTSKRRWKRFFYFIFVVVLITALIVLFLFLGDKYLGFNVW